MANRSEIYRINDANLALRRQFVQLGSSDIRTLRGLHGWAQRNADRMAREFYDHQFAFAPTREFFEAHARNRGTDIGALRRALEQAQAGYLRDIFDEAKAGGQFGVSYYEKRLHVGALHNTINLPLKWYVGSYALHQNLVRKYLRRAYPWKPWFWAKAERAIFAVFNFDAQAVADAFFIEYLQSIGLQVQTVAVPRADRDVTDHVADLKAIMRTTILETSNASDLLGEASTRMLDITAQSRDAIEQIASTIQQVAQGTTDQVSALESAVTAVASMNSQADRVSTKVDEIRDIAGRIDLLALNAAIEAAHAGEAGRGFAVVADEVRSLAETAAKVVREIDAAVGEMRAVSAQATAATTAVAAVSEQTAAAAEQISATTEQVAAQAQETANQAGQLARTAASVKDIIKNFHIDDAGNGQGHGGPGGRPNLRRVA